MPHHAVTPVGSTFFETGPEPTPADKHKVQLLVVSRLPKKDAIEGAGAPRATVPDTSFLRRIL